MADDDLCQVCGGPRGATVHVLAGRRDLAHDPTRVRQAGGALCSLRCARLTAAVCPHYRRQWPVRVYAVPHPGARSADAGGRQAVDDLADVTAPGARHLATVGAIDADPVTRSTP
jgi:hypothetical protein